MTLKIRPRQSHDGCVPTSKDRRIRQRFSSLKKPASWCRQPDDWRDWRNGNSVTSWCLL